MKKLVIFALMALSCGVLFAETDMYLYWMIGADATFTDKSGQTVGKEVLETMTAKIGYTYNGQDTYLDLYDSYLNQFAASTEGTAFGNVFDFETFAGTFAQNDSYSFFVELANGSMTLRSSDSASYSALMPYISSMKGQATPAAAYGFRTFTQAVPEPTSGLLLLLGVAGLALRRKNKKA